MAYTKEKRFLVHKYNKPKEVRALISDCGDPDLFAYEDEEDYYQADEDYLLFSDLPSAEAHLATITPQNSKQVRDYLDYLYECGDDDVIEEFLPSQMFKMFKKGFNSHMNLSRSEWEWVKDALSGRIVVGARSLRPSDIAMVTSLSGNRRELLLSNGSVIVVHEDIEVRIIDAVFRHHTSGRYINR